MLVLKPGAAAPPLPPPVQLYKPLEFLFLVAAFTTLAENFLPQLIAIPKVRPQLRRPAPVPCHVAWAVGGGTRASSSLSLHFLHVGLLTFPLLPLASTAPAVQSIVQTVVRSTLSLTFVISACRVVFNIKARVIRQAPSRVCSPPLLATCIPCPYQADAGIAQGLTRHF